MRIPLWKRSFRGKLFLAFLVIGLVLYLVRMLPLDGNIKNILQIIVIIIGIISLLRYLAVF